MVYLTILSIINVVLSIFYAGWYTIFASCLIALYFTVSRVYKLNTSSTTKMSNYTFYLVLLSEAALFVIFLLTAYWYAISVNVLTPIFKTDGNYVSLITLLLVWSSFTLPNLKSDRFTSSILITIALGIMFLYIQLCEYRYIGYTIATSSVYSAFYTLTGLHIIHVILGIVLLVLALATPTAFSTDLYFKYWHFVDIIWVILYLTVY